MAQDTSHTAFHGQKKNKSQGHYVTIFHRELLVHNLNISSLLNYIFLISSVLLF